MKITAVFRQIWNDVIGWIFSSPVIVICNDITHIILNVLYRSIDKCIIRVFGVSLISAVHFYSETINKIEEIV